MKRERRENENALLQLIVFKALVSVKFAVKTFHET